MNINDIMNSIWGRYSVTGVASIVDKTLMAHNLTNCHYLTGFSVATIVAFPGATELQSLTASSLRSFANEMAYLNSLDTPYQGHNYIFPRLLAASAFLEHYQPITTVVTATSGITGSYLISCTETMIKNQITPQIEEENTITRQLIEENIVVPELIEANICFASETYTAI